MRVRVLRETQAYWNYAIQTLKKDDEFDGDFARHLADNASKGTVEILEDDREQMRAPEPDPEPADPDPTGPGPDTGGAPPADGTIEDLMTWVDGDPDRAKRALDAEQAKDKPRSTVIKRLAALTENE